MGSDWKIIKCENILKDLASKGYIELCEETGATINRGDGQKYTINYIYGIKNNKFNFIIDNIEYREKYLSGCFYPYLVYRYR